MLAMIRHGEGALAIVRLQQTDPAAGTGQSASNFSSREWERVMLDLVVTHWFRFVYALIGGRAGLKADDARRAAEAKAEAKAAEDARRAAEAKAAEEARRAAEAKAAEDARRAAEAKAAEDARRAAEAKAAEEARRAAEAKAAKEARRVAKTKAAEDTRRVAEANAVRSDDASGSCNADETMISAMCTGSEAAFPAMSGEDGAHGFGLRRHDKDFLVRSRIAERDRAADPDPFALRRRDLVAHPFADHLALELGEGQHRRTPRGD